MMDPDECVHLAASRYVVLHHTHFVTFNELFFPFGRPKKTRNMNCSAAVSLNVSLGFFHPTSLHCLTASFFASLAFVLCSVAFFALCPLHHAYTRGDFFARLAYVNQLIYLQ